MSESKKPPLGIMPRYLHDENRLNEINEAILRSVDAGRNIPEAWIVERRDLMKNLKEGRGK